MGGGGGGVGMVDGSLPHSFWYVAVFWNDFTFSGKTLTSLSVVALLEACDVSNNGHHLGFYQELEIRLKPLEMVSFCAFHWLCMISATRFTFIVERSWKNMYFHPKLAWPPATDNAISRNHSNWPSLNLSQNLREVWANSCWKRQVLMFFSLGKNSEKTLRGMASPPPPPLYVRGLKVCKTFLSLMTIKFLLLRKYASPLSFCCRWFLLPKCALSNRNISQKWMKTEE